MTINKSNIGVQQKQKILLVDDDSSFLLVAQKVLKAKGYDIDVVSRAQDAIPMAQKYYYNLAILDIQLPDMNGIDLLSNLTKIYPDIVAIMLTGYSSVENSVEALNRGAFAFLEKPLKPDRLLEAIERGLEKQQLLIENRRLVNELEHRNGDLNVLLSISQAVSCSLDSENIVDAGLDIISKSMACQAGYFIFYKNGSLDIKRFKCFNEQLQNSIKTLVTESRIINTLYKNNLFEQVNNIECNNDRLLSCLDKNGYKSFLAVPLIQANDIKGVMGIATKEYYDFSKLEVDMIETAAREVAVALTNIQLIEEASSARALRELDAMRTELLANVSHELRTPLAAIKGFASSLLQPDISFDDETRQSFIQTIDSEADRLNQLIEDLLLMSRIEGGGFRARKEVFDIDEIIGSIRDRLYNLTIKHNLKITVPEDLPTVIVDGPRIGQVISNLVENAVKYSTEGTEIRVEVEKHEKEIVISVIDCGIGIPEEYQSKVFDRYNQVACRNGGRKGNGLGLCICRGIIESHGGKIWLESHQGKGTKFSFCLPLCEKVNKQISC